MFSELQQANKDRAAYWTTGGKSPGPEFSVIELGGEIGELKQALDDLIGHFLVMQNPIKKNIRELLGMAGGSSEVTQSQDELGYVVICCSLLANKLGWDLGEITARKFNKTSDKHGFPVKLAVQEKSLPRVSVVMQYDSSRDSLPGFAAGEGRY